MFKFISERLGDKWKDKAKDRNYNIKQLKKRIKELTKNRDKWKDEADKFKNLYKVELKKTFKRKK